MPQTKPRTPAAQGIRTASLPNTVQLQTLWTAIFNETPASALAEMIPLARQQRVQAWIFAQPNYADLHLLLRHDAPKVRKNTARLLGQMQKSDDLPALTASLAHEETLFVLPSLILAIGRFDDDEAKNALERFSSRMAHFPETVENKKHLDQIAQALKTASQRFETLSPCSFTALPTDVVIHARAIKGCGALLRQEALASGMKATLKKDTLVASPAQFLQTTQLRCAKDILIPLSQNEPAPLFPAKAIDIQNWVQSLTPAFLHFAALAKKALRCERVHYRIELQGIPHASRASLAHEIVFCMNSIAPDLHNSNAHYHMELRIEYASLSQRASIYARLFVPSDSRFAYRKQSLPASIHPVTAASLMHFALPHLKKDAQVLDPCCGSGTLLIERGMITPTKALVGVDKDVHAIAIARENASHANMPASFIAKKMETFTPQEPFDEIIANLPFGTRVGTQQTITAFHTELVKRLDVFLHAEGIAILYSTQHRLLRQLAKRFGWHIVNEMPFPSGGLIPWGMILQKP